MSTAVTYYTMSESVGSTDGSFLFTWIVGSDCHTHYIFLQKEILTSTALARHLFHHCQGVTGPLRRRLHFKVEPSVLRYRSAVGKSEEH